MEKVTGVRFIGQQWLASLRYLIPSQQFLRLLWRGTVTFFKYFWWLILLDFIIWGICDRFGFIEMIHPVGLFFYYIPPIDPAYMFYALRIIEFFLIYMVILSVRYTPEKKDFSYFITRSMQFFNVAIVSTILWSIHLLVSNSGLPEPLQGFIRGVLFSDALALVPPLWGAFQSDWLLMIIFPIFLISPVIIFAIFFVIDARWHLKNIFLSIPRAFKMMFVIYPFCLLSMLFIFFIYFYGLKGIIIIRMGLKKIVDIHEPVIIFAHVKQMLLTLLPYLFATAWFNTAYEKQIRENPELYTS